MNIIKWILGAIMFIGVVTGIIVYPLPFLFNPDLPNVPFLGRAIFILLFAAAMCLYRVMQGPTAADRSVAIDIFGILVVSFCAVLSISTGRSWYLDIGIAWALQSFIGSLALAKYLESRSYED
jgi:multicomponent Na+:H+ antiporter subunit F